MVGSGTTGLPKASPLSIARFYKSASTGPKTFGQRPGPGGDRAYYCIPLYHGTGGISAIENLMSGVSVALAPKFSLSRFWQDCIDSKATIFVYGELYCRRAVWCQGLLGLSWTSRSHPGAGGSWQNTGRQANDYRGSGKETKVNQSEKLYVTCYRRLHRPKKRTIRYDSSGEMA